MIETLQKQGQIIIISGPSGVGKTTLVDALLEQSSNMVRSVSATTRSSRIDETDGVDYHFLPKSDFERLIEQNGLVECTRTKPVNFPMKNPSKTRSKISTTVSLTIY